MSDPRFARLKTDPRFRQLKKAKHKVVIDDRFKSVLDQGKKKDKVKGKVDKYGRALSSTHEEDNLKRFYRLDREEEDEDEEEAPARPDYARGGVLMESSDEDEDEEPDVKGDESDDEGFVTLGGENEEDPYAEIDLDEDTMANLDAQAKAFADENQNEDDDEDGSESRTRRLAIINLDWDHVRAAHLYKICASLVSPSAPSLSSKPKTITNNKREPKKAPQVNAMRGKVLSVVVYPSDFGKERIAREEKEGPPAEIFRTQKDDGEITVKSLYEVGGEGEVNENALRKYQLERLRYYYAVVNCDSVDAASHIYDELQGTELERSANVFDISFVPDDMSFDHEPRDEATEAESSSVKPLDFVTDALRHSKVKLTWDEDDPERNQVTRRTLTAKEIEEGDFRAYIASSSESEAEVEASTSKKKNKKKERERLRSLLLGGNEEAMPEGWGDENGSDVDMEITFTPGLLGKSNDADETTLEKYQRKMREKRKKRKEEFKETETAGKGKDKEDADDFFEVESDKESNHKPASKDTKKGKKAKKGKSADDDNDSARKTATAEELALLVASNNPNADTSHFDFKAVVKSEKSKGKKQHRKNKKAKDQESNELQEDFVMDVQDDRFKMLHEDHRFAIDPSNPHFKKTKGMDALLDERRKRSNKRPKDGPSKASTTIPGGEERSIEKLVESVKRKSFDSQHQGQGKRRRL